MLKVQQLGFNLIELMMVVAIISILAAIAIPSYHHYSNKAKFTEVIQAIAPFKLAIETCAHQQSQLSDCTNDGAYIPPSFNAPDVNKGYVKNVAVRAVNNNIIQIIATSQNIGNNQNYTYLLNAILQTDGQLQWSKDHQSTCLAAGLC